MITHWSEALLLRAHIFQKEGGEKGRFQRLEL